MPVDAYKTLGVTSNASKAEIKASYRRLVKKHHPDRGGDAEKILAINAAWELLKDPKARLLYDKEHSYKNSFAEHAHQREVRNARASAAAKESHSKSAAEDDALLHWVQEVYTPIDRLLSQVINPFSEQLKALSADPYDDSLMDTFCSYLNRSQTHLKKVKQIYQSMSPPKTASNFGLDLYHCLSQVEDAMTELQRYTMGYVDSYLHDGKEMLRKAKQRKLSLKRNCRQMEIQ